MEEQKQEGQESGITSATTRRTLLLQHMKQLGSAGVGCANCSGLCCTHLANSMQVTPVELRDIADWLGEHDRLTGELKERLQHTVSRYRLDVEVGHGRRALRKTYTCPFYTPGPTGCSIAPEVKPYGCLAFNARSPGASEGSDCGSDHERLEKREEHDPDEAAMNDQLRADWNLYWDKAPLPVALLDVWDRLPFTDH